MVAKSFQNMEVAEGPYIVSGRNYVKVRNPKTGSLRQVRWYEDWEYRKMYPEDFKETMKEIKTQKETLGFTNGYITIFKGDTYPVKDWLKDHGARYTRLWGWYFMSDEDIPESFPEGIEAVRLNWTLVGNESGSLYPDAKVEAVIESIMYETQGEFVGEIGDKLELWLTVEKAIELDGFYGRSTMHIMYDDDGNTYVWTTSSKSWSEGTEHHIKCSVKDHKVYKGVQQTVLTRCRSLD